MNSGLRREIGLRTNCGSKRVYVAVGGVVIIVTGASWRHETLSRLVIMSDERSDGYREYEGSDERESRLI